MTQDTVSFATSTLLVRQMPAEMVILAASTLSRHLDISQSEAEAQLRSGSIKLDRTVDAASEDRLRALLAALGLSQRAGEAPFDQVLSLQMINPADQAYIAPKLAVLLQMDVAVVAHALQRPGGLIIETLSTDQAAHLRKQCRRHHGVRTAISHTNAICDLFLAGALPAGLGRELSRYLAVMGAAPCRFSGALAAGLSLRQTKQIRARFYGADLISLDRAFQRFDLFLTSIGDLDAQDVAAFLSTRSNLSGAMVECVTPLQPLQIEKSLTRAAAQQFQADYAAIGLQTCARLGIR